MSDAIFPVFPGLTWDSTKTPIFKTQVQESLSGCETRMSLWRYPLWDFTVKYELLRDTEMRALCGFFLARKGSFDSFLYVDPLDSAVSDQSIGLGDGINKTFQLQRFFGGTAEPVMWPTAISIKINGVVSTAYTLGSLGVVTFVTAPAAGAGITWTGNYKFRCRFKEDAVNFNQFAYKLWDLQTLSFRGCLGDKL